MAAPSLPKGGTRVQLRKLRSLDASLADVDASGLRDFGWPLSWREQQRFRDAFVAGYAKLSRELQDKQDEDGDLLAILAMEFVQEAMRGWFGAALLARYRQRGEDVSAPWLRSASVEEPAFWQPQRDRIGFLKTRFPASGWRALLRPAYGLTQDDGLSWRWPQTVDFRSRIVATNPCPLTRRHARQAGERPVLVSMRHWFGDASDSLPGDLTALRLRAETAAAVLGVFVEAARLNGDTMPAALQEHLADWLDDATAICRWYLRALLARPQRLPAQLWTGSGGYIFRRILHVAARRAGGTAWSHDHGSGLGLFDIIDTNLTEFVTPDVFVTFSRKQADGYRKQERDAFRIRRQWPRIEAVAGDHAAPLRARAPTAGKPRSILFVANQYRGEKITLTPIEFDLVAADWQARLFGRLLSLGYDVRMRPHPDSISAPPPGLTRMGVATAGGRFEQALASADAVILDYLHTSVLRDVLLSGKPVLTFEFGHCPPNAVARDGLARRIRFVPAWYDEANRTQTDWDSLPAALADACAMRGDQTFIDLFET
jgi:hypothetical protein